MRRLPLENLRVIDLGQVYAGPYTARVLADMGAEVIRVESAVRSGRGGQNPQPGAVYPDNDPGERPYNRSAYYNELNRNKLAVSLDLSKDRGREIFKRLVKVSDVVIENFSPRVMANFGLDYPVLSQVNPRIIMASISGYGQTGRYRDYVNFGRGIEAMSGLSEITGYADSQPLGPGIAYADANSGLHAAFAILVALRQRRRTGKGQHIDLSLRESLTSLLGEQVLDFSMNRRLPARKGNRDCPAAFQGCYRCLGDDAWIAISICSELEWKALLSVIDSSEYPPELISEEVQDSSCRGVGEPVLSLSKDVPQFYSMSPKIGGSRGPALDQDRGLIRAVDRYPFSEITNRETCQDDLARLIERWTLQQEPAQAMDILQQAGVRAGMVCGAGELLSNPHLNARGFFENVSHPEAGTHPNPGMPWKFSRTPLKIRMPAPCFAQHNNYVFGDLLGMSSEEIANLEEEGITARFPSR